MNPEQWGRLREIFFAVCEAPTEEREKVLVSLCNGDTDMMAGVRDLLAADDENVGANRGAAAFLDQPALGRVLSEVALNEVGEQSLSIEQIGPYRVVQKLGEGGMGTVFEADQEHPRRKVAVKVLRPGASSPHMLRRFRQEADLLAQLQHPWIARIYDAGIGEVICKGQVIGRQPFFAMEMVRGRTIVEHVRASSIPMWEVMKLMAQVADAVQHAHQNGIIHRDLKPGNILVDENGDPKVLDFGVARPLDALQTRASLQTQTGQIVGTLAYMSPEQVSGDSAQVDTRSDVYSLGVILYELLAGRPPHDVRGLTLTAAIRIIRDKTPDNLERIRPELRGDVSRIVAKAMEKERERRYQSAGAIADDIRRFLSDQPVLARPSSAIYQLRKFARRNKALVGGVIATLVSLIIGMAGIVWFAIGESRARTDAEAASKKAMRLAHRVSIAAAGDAIERLSFGQARGLLEAIPADERKWEWHYFWNQLGNSYSSLTGADHAIRNLQFAPDGSELLAITNVSLLRWDLHTSTMTRLLQGARNQNVSHFHDQQIAVNEDLSHAAAIGVDGGIQLLNRRTGSSKLLKSEGRKMVAIALSPDSSLIAVGGEDGQVHVLSWQTGVKSLSKRFQGTVRSLQFAPRGPCLAIQTSHQSAVLDIDTGETLNTIPIEDSEQPDLFTWLKDGSQLFYYCFRGRGACVQSFRVLDRSSATLCGLTDELTELVVTPNQEYACGSQYDGKIRMWDLHSSEIIRTFQSPDNGMYGLAIHPSGQSIAVGDISGQVRVFDVPKGNTLGVLRGLASCVTSLAFNIDGSVIAAGANDGSVRLWRNDILHDNSVLRGHTSYVYPVAFSPDGKTIASGSWDLTIRLWDSSTGRELNVLRGHKIFVYWLSFSPDGQRLMSLSSRSGIAQEQIVWDIKTGEVLAQKAQSMADEARPVFCSESKRVWLAQTGDTSVNVWDWETNVVTRESLSALRGTKSPWISNDQTNLAQIVGDDSRLQLLDFNTGQVRHTLCAHATRAVFSPDNRLIAGLSHSKDRSGKGDFVGIWLVQTGQQIGELRHEGGEIFDVAFSPDGTRIVTCGRDKLIHIWDAGTLEETVGLRGHTDYVWSIAWSPDGSTLASGSGDSTVRLWKSK